MEAIKHIIKISADRQLHIQLPDSATVDEEAEVIVIFKSAPANVAEKISAMREAVNDPLFLADLNEAMEDFAYPDAINEQRLES